MAEVTEDELGSEVVGLPAIAVRVVCWLLLSVPLSLVGGSGDCVKFLAKGVEASMDNVGSREGRLGRGVVGLTGGVVSGTALFREGSR